MLLTAVCGAGDLAHTVSSTRFCILLSFSLLMTAVCGAGDLAHTASLALLCISLSFSLLLTAVCGAGDLAQTVPSAHFCLLLSFSLLMSAVCGAGDVAYTASLAPLYVLLSFSLLLTAVCGAGDLAHTVSTASLYIWRSFFLAVNHCVWRWGSSPCNITSVLSWQSLILSHLWWPLVGHVCKYSCCAAATNYPPITLLQEDIHSFRDDMLLAIVTFYMLSYRTVGTKIDGNFCPYLLSPTAPAPRTRCLGKSVARFARPFESRPADTVRRELYKQLATQPGNSGWIAPTAALPATPRPLERATEASFAPRKGHKCKRRLQF